MSATRLSPQLRRVSDLLLQGLRYDEIASQMALSYRTVYNYASEIYSRFGVHSRSEFMARVERPQTAAQITHAMRALALELAKGDAEDRKCAAMLFREVDRRAAL